MHDDDIASDPDLVRVLIAQQMPELSGMRVAPFPSGGTDNAMYRVEDQLAARLPRRPSACVLLEKEARILPRLGALRCRCRYRAALGRKALHLPIRSPSWTGSRAPRPI
jgi:aminoglycoside phosphotransferase (APT) family kinase protein